MPVVEGAPADDARAIYIMTRDNILEGDTGASGLARRLRQTVNLPAPLRIRVPPHVGSNFEGLVMRIEDADGGAGHLWKLVRTFDDPGTWTETGETTVTPEPESLVLVGSGLVALAATARRRFLRS